MSSENNQIVQSQASPYVATTGISASVLGLINWLAPDTETANKLAFLAVPVGAFISYWILWFIARYMTSPEQIAKEQKLLKDKTRIQEILAEAQDYPERYTSEQITEYRSELHQTNLLLVRLGRQNNPHSEPL